MIWRSEDEDDDWSPRGPGPAGEVAKAPTVSGKLRHQPDVVPPSAAGQFVAAPTVLPHAPIALSGEVVSTSLVFLVMGGMDL
eukprot:CAMPEP_0197870580 /NCGR_PEP_ID=MMETSP1439-20131203/1219_1 /TAXON_ID=66791 /ORGANISM="Gonyaulax spinifera, Strain CCMP409" /LENGTH=81 /DNA_ID=CAMNT_0043489475 /DNA_START=18 /DNA_END=259 /DNA_ORIENTATION=+